MSLYTAASLADIARLFDQLAGRAEVWADQTTGPERKLRAREAVIWRQAATMLRDTTLSPPEVSP